MKRGSEDGPLTIGRYELLFELATGGMGRVFAARQVGDAGFERIVALKRVHAHLVRDPEVYAMTSDEARLSALLHHPNVVPVIDVVDAKGELVLVMEYVEGVSLASLLRSRASSADGAEPGERSQRVLPLGVASRIVLDALRGLGAAHDACDLAGEKLELVHRDVSPQNLLVGVDGTTRLIDFGIARAEGRLALTKTGVIKGKVVYMAPERLEEREVDRRADLFSVGAVLYELCAGRWAFGAGDDAAQMSRILLGEIDFERLEERAPSVVPVVARALSRSPRDRFDDAAAFADALAEALPPASHDEVRALLLAEKGAELASRRARLSSAVAERLAQGEDEADEVDADAAGASIAVSARAPEAPSAGAGTTSSAKGTEESPPRRSSSWVVAFGVGALVVNAAGWYAMTRTSDASGRAPSSSADVARAPSSVESPIDRAPTAATGPAVSPAASTPVASSTVAPQPSSTPRAGGLEPSPYGAGLRKSPYKRP